MTLNKVIMLWEDVRNLEIKKKFLFDAMRNLKASKLICNCPIQTKPIIRKIELYELTYPEQARESVDNILENLVPFRSLKSFLFHVIFYRILKIKRFSSMVGRNRNGGYVMNSRSAVLFTRDNHLDKKTETELRKRSFKCPSCNGYFPKEAF